MAQTQQSEGATPDPLANLITQVSPTGYQPSRAPVRPNRSKAPAAKSKSKASKAKDSAAPSAASPGPAPALASEESTKPVNSQESSFEDDSKTSHAQDASSTLVEPSSDGREDGGRDSKVLSTPKEAPSHAQPTQPPRTSQQQHLNRPQPSRKKKSSPSPWTSFLMALGCVSKQAHDDDNGDAASISSNRSTSSKRRRAQKLNKGSRSADQQRDSVAPVPMTQITRPSEDQPQEASTSAAAEADQQRDLAPLVAAPSSDSAIAPPSPSSSTAAAATGSGIPLPREETGDVMSGAVVPPGADGHHSAQQTMRKRRSKSSTRTTESADGLDSNSAPVSSSEAVDSEEDEDEEESSMLNEDEEEERIIQAGGMGIPLDEDGHPRPLLGPVHSLDTGRKCLVLDLDETLVHSSFKQIQAADYIVPVEIENQTHNVFVIKRPGVDEFLRRMGEIYEVVVFTASLSKYADPVLDQLDIHRVVRHRLFRESCYNHKGNYVKDLSQLGRPINECIIIDNSPASYIFHPKNAVPVSSWFNDPHDTELVDMIGVLADLAEVDDVRSVLDGFLDEA